MRSYCYVYIAKPLPNDVYQDLVISIRILLSNKLDNKLLIFSEILLSLSFRARYYCLDTCSLVCFATLSKLNTMLYQI